MLYIPKIDDYLKILTDAEVKVFVVINSSEYFKYIREEQSLRKVATLAYIFLTTLMNSKNMCNRYDVEILNIFDLELQLINTKPMIKNKLEELLSELKNFKAETIQVLDYKK